MANIDMVVTSMNAHTRFDNVLNPGIIMVGRHDRCQLYITYFKYSTGSWKEHNYIAFTLMLVAYSYRVAQKKTRNGILPTTCRCNNWYQFMR